MRRALAILPLALLFIANVVPSKAQSEVTSTTAATSTTTEKPIQDRVQPVAGSDSDPGTIQYYDIPRNVSFTCSNPSKVAVVWEKNNTEISQVAELKDRYKIEGDNGARLVIPRSSEEDYGNYSCKAGEDRLYWQLHARPYTKLPSTDSSVVEGQKLKLVCRVIGKPVVPVEWYYDSLALPYDPKLKNMGIKVAETDRLKLVRSEAGVERGELVIEAAERGDAGAYYCLPIVDTDARSPHEVARTVLRVKDMYAALWPFLGICAEVLVLCAIILVYEKRRTKPEMDDSDTDNHDQKKS